jgi:DNA primase
MPPRRGARPRLVVSDTLRNSRLLRPSDRGIDDDAARGDHHSQTLVNHPALVEDKFEVLAALDCETPVAQKVISDILALAVRHPGYFGSSDLHGGAGGPGTWPDALDRMAETLTRHGVWQVAVRRRR